MERTFDVRAARVWTGWPERPWAEAIRVEDGRIVALDPATSPGVPAVDAGGRVVLPGFIDAHVHLLLGGASLRCVELSGVGSRAEFEAAIAEGHRRLPPDVWLVAQGWSEDHWPGGATPDKSWLAAAGARPVVCHRMDYHAVLVNDAVLAQCDLEARAASIGDRGRIARDERGAPTGLLVEAAAWELVNPFVPRATAATAREDLRAAQRHLSRLGVTAVGAMEYMHTVDDVLLPARDELTVRCRVTLLDRAWPMSFGYGADFANDERLAVIGYKTFLDGTFGSRTARMLAPYAGDPDNRGLWLELAADGVVAEWAQGVARAGLSPSMHAIGDAAVRLALDVVEDLRSAGLHEAAPRIEHAQHVDPADVPRFRDVIASMQPLHRAEDGCTAAARLGAERLAGAFAFRDLATAGAQLAFGSDWPIVSCDPLAGVCAAVTGRTISGEPFQPEQNLTVDETLAAYTRGAAHALRIDDAGVLRPGMRADLVMLDGDPWTADWLDTPPTVAATIVGGRLVHDAR